jgi:hypothetical protein
MKRSKIFLGVTATILAVAGFAASKAKSTISKTCYITAGHNATIVSHGQVTGAKTVQNSNPVKFAGRQLYTYLNSAHSCTLPLYSE